MSIGLYEKREERIVRSSLSSSTPSVSSLTFYRDIAETRCSNNGYERKREESFNRPSGNVKKMRRRYDDELSRRFRRMYDELWKVGLKLKFPGQLRERIVTTTMAANMVKFWTVCTSASVDWSSSNWQLCDTSVDLFRRTLILGKIVRIF